MFGRQRRDEQRQREEARKIGELARQRVVEYWLEDKIVEHEQRERRERRDERRRCKCCKAIRVSPHTRALRHREPQTLRGGISTLSPQRAQLELDGFERLDAHHGRALVHRV